MTKQINKFFYEFHKYIYYQERNKIKVKYKHVFDKLRKKLFKNKLERTFIKSYKHLDKFIDKQHDKDLNNHLDLIKDVSGIALDISQKKAILSDEDNTLIIAGAGSGKTLTMVGKINYLINVLKINPKQILCISFTNDAVNSLSRKINNQVEVLTFHKLALKILNNEYFITDITLDYVVDEYFSTLIYNNEYMIKKVLKLFKSELDIELYKHYLDKPCMMELKQIVITFINLFKANNYNIDKFIEIDNKQDHDILSIIIDIYFLYTNELKSQNLIDFNDMINLATKKINENIIKLKYKYIIIDEYQDTSYTRYELIKAIKNQTCSKIIAVGDDFQSIYKFTGCNLSLFTNFEKYFGYTKKIYIDKTYRNSQELISVAGKFILKNKNQIKKNLKSNKRRNKPIKIIYEDEHVLEELFDYLSKNNIKDIMVLGRNNEDIKKYLNGNIIINKDIITYKKNTNLNIRYLTVHKSKGLESECVIIINLEDRISGFPNKMKNNHVIDLISYKDEYPYAEERRLFYVALTRTLTDTYLIIPTSKCSIFVEEIIKDNKKYIEYIDL